MASLVLFSGGMDSTIGLFWALNINAATPVHAITFDYAQKHRREIEQSRKIWTFVKERTPFGKRLAFHTVVPLVLPRVGSLMTSGVPVRQYDEKPTEDEAHRDPAFIPYRNLIFLSVAAAHAQAHDCSMIVTGLRGGFPDCTTAFERAFERLANMADPLWPLTVTSPVHDDRATCIYLAQTLPHCIPALGLSHTCFVGGDQPCGKCLPCIKRAEGFATVGIKDPIFDPPLTTTALGDYKHEFKPL